MVVSTAIAPFAVPRRPRRPLRALARAVLRPLVSHLVHRTFVAEEAATPRQRAEAFRIRYEVYCLELGYEDPAKSPFRQEVDEADEHARHCLLWHRPSGQYAGCVRLVQAGGDPLPVERTCGSTLPSDWCERHGLARTQVAEISRLALRPAFRTGTRRPRLEPPASLLLSLCAAACIFNHEMDAVVALMRPALARRLCGSGLPFVPIGPAVEHRGLRAPYLCKRPDVEAELGVLGLALLDFLRADLEHSMPSTARPLEDGMSCPLDPATISVVGS